MTTITENQPTKDEAEIRQLTSRWLSIFSPKDRPFTGVGFENVFATEKNKILVFDNCKNDVVVLRSLKEYLDTWVPFMQENISYWKVKLEDNFEITIDGDLAVTTFS